jgi:hypothetical protein
MFSRSVQACVGSKDHGALAQEERWADSDGSIEEKVADLKQVLCEKLLACYENPPQHSTSIWLPPFELIQSGSHFKQRSTQLEMRILGELERLRALRGCYSTQSMLQKSGGGPTTLTEEGQALAAALQQVRNGREQLEQLDSTFRRNLSTLRDQVEQTMRKSATR